MTTTLTRPSSSPSSPPDQRRVPARAEPSARRNHTRIALGLLVVVLSVLGTVTLYTRADDRIEVLAVGRSVAEGQEITADDLAVVSLSSDSELRTIPASEESRVVGQMAAVDLVPGSLLTQRQVSSGPRVPDGMVLTGATLKPGQYPVGLRAGDSVLVVETPTAAATGAAAAPIDRGRARVVDLAELEDASSSIAVSMVVPSDAATAIAAAGSSGRLTLVVVGEQ